MSRIFFFVTILFLHLVPVHGFNILSGNAYGLDRQYQIKGKIIDNDSRSPMEFAHVSLFHHPDSVRLQITATNLKGEFSFSNLPPGNYSVTAHFMGYKDFNSVPFTVEGKPATIELDPIPLREENISLGEITVRTNAGKPSYQLDKKVIYVENQLSGSGGSASDLLQKLPSVTQSPDGKIAFHGNSNLLVFINGKPSALKGNELLMNTSAAEIKKIELITSPSAKYDAAGSGGIINLITNRSTSDGVNGNFQAGADQLGGYSSDMLLNFKYHRFGFFTGIDHNKRKNEGDIKYATNYLSSLTDFTKTGLQKAMRINTGFRTGADYQITEADKFIVSGNGGSFTTANDGAWETVTTYQPKNNPIRKSETDGNDRKGKYGGVDFSFEHKLDTLNKTLSVSALWNTFRYDDNFLNLVNGVAGNEEMRQTTLLSKANDNYQFNADFTTPSGKTGTFELGYQLTYNKEQETYDSELRNPSPPVTSNQETNFREIIQAGYGTYQYKISHLEIKAGLRAENLSRSLKTLTNEYKSDHFDLYPTFNSVFKFDASQELLLNYTRRTDHLKTIQLDPLPRWYDFYNVMTGNPDLNHEITDKIALDYFHNGKTLNFNSELYWYNISDKIELIRSIYQAGIIQNRYENIGKERTLGVEFNVNWTASEWLSFNEKFDLIDTRLDVNLNHVSSQKKYNQWYAVSTADLTLSPSTMLELDFSYYGPSMTAQSNIEQVYLAGLSLRQMFFSKKLVFTLTGRDVLGFYSKVEKIDGADFNQTITTKNRFPIRFSISYKFNHYKRDEKRLAKIPVLD